MRRRDLLTTFVVTGVSVVLTRAPLKASELPRVGILGAGLTEQFEAFFAGMRVELDALAPGWSTAP